MDWNRIHPTRAIHIWVEIFVITSRTRYRSNQSSFYSSRFALLVEMLPTETRNTSNRLINGGRSSPGSRRTPRTGMESLRKLWRPRCTRDRHQMPRFYARIRDTPRKFGALTWLSAMPRHKYGLTTLRLWRGPRQ